MSRNYLLVFAFLPLMAAGQKTAQLDEKTIVRDSSGKILPFSAWTQLLSSGYFSIKPENPKNKKSDFLLIRMTEDERRELLESLGKPNGSPNFRTGQKLKPFRAVDIDGIEVDLEKLRGKIVVLNFWFIKCGPCRREIPELNRMVAGMRDSTDVVFLAVGLDDKESIFELDSKEPFYYQLIPDGTSISQLFGVRGYPTHAILDREGKVYFHTVGLAINTVYWLEKSIRELLNKK